MESLQDTLEEETISSELQKGESMFFQKFNKALRYKEKMWRFKSHNLWLNSGDINTSIFHRQVKVILLKNNVK